MGNHDREILETDPLEQSTDPGRRWVLWHRAHLSEQNLLFLAGCADEEIIINREGGIRAIHGDIRHPAGSRIWPDSPPEVFDYLRNKYSEPCILLGHSHVQFGHEQDGTRFINPGSAGAPYLGHPLACYAVINDGRIELKGTPYDIEKTCRVMRKRARGVADEEYIDDWIQGWRTGNLPKRYFIRDYSMLHAKGYR
jgi:predicted phosphodiesterase